MNRKFYEEFRKCFYKSSSPVITKDLLVELKFKRQQIKNMSTKNETSIIDAESHINIRLLNRRRETAILNYPETKISQYLPSFQKIEESLN
jgi:hypothetical protein